jgi:hypothetical protein
MGVENPGRLSLCRRAMPPRDMEFQEAGETRRHGTSRQHLAQFLASRDEGMSLTILLVRNGSSEK